jgi:hypothetical protein
MALNQEKESIINEVTELFKRKVTGSKEGMIYYTEHASEKMSKYNLETTQLEFCMYQTKELIEFHWEFPNPGIKLIFLCEPDDFSPFHVVCLLFEGRLVVKTAYVVSSDKYKSDNRTRVKNWNNN